MKIGLIFFYFVTRPEQGSYIAGLFIKGQNNQIESRDCILIL